MNLLLHGIGSQESEPVLVRDSLAADPGDRFDMGTRQATRPGRGTQNPIGRVKKKGG